jgi:hypothetical protein
MWQRLVYQQQLLGWVHAGQGTPQPARCIPSWLPHHAEHACALHVDTGPAVPFPGSEHPCTWLHVCLLQEPWIIGLLAAHGLLLVTALCLRHSSTGLGVLFFLAGGDQPCCAAVRLRLLHLLHEGIQCCQLLYLCALQLVHVVEHSSKAVLTTCSFARARLLTKGVRS